jgi:hypothetical protein
VTKIDLILRQLPSHNHIDILYSTLQNTFTVHSILEMMTVPRPFNNISKFMELRWPPLWSSGQSSWLRIRRPGFDSRHYQKKKVVGLERGSLSLVSTTEELLDRKVAVPVQKNREYGRRDPSR